MPRANGNALNVSIANWPRPPRTVRRRPDGWKSIWKGRVIGALILGLDALWIGIFALPTATRHFGKDAVAEVVRVEPTPDSRPTARYLTIRLSGAPSQSTTYRHDYRIETTVPSIGSTVPVRVLTIGSFRDVEFLRNGDSLSSWICFASLLAIASTFLIPIGIAMFVMPVFERRLLRTGSVAIATITGKDSSWNPSGGRGYYLNYEFSLPDRSVQHDYEQVPKALYNRINEGESMIVLYPPHKPRRSRLYDHMSHEIGSGSQQGG